MHAWKRRAKLKRLADFLREGRYAYRHYPLIFRYECYECRYFAYPLCVRIGLPKQFQYCKYTHDRHLKKGENHLTKFYRSENNGREATVFDGRAPRNAQKSDT